MRTAACIASISAPPRPRRLARQSAGSVHRPSRTCASYSARNSFIVVSTGVAAASPNAQSVLPTMLFDDAEEQVEIFHLSFAALDAQQQLVEPVAAFAAWRALAARLVAVEVQQVHRRATPCRPCRPAR